MTYAKLPGDIARGWRSIRIEPDGKPDFPAGAPCRIGRPADQPLKSCRLKIDAGGGEVAGMGMRKR